VRKYVNHFPGSLGTVHDRELERTLETYSRIGKHGFLWFTHRFGGERVAFAWGYGGPKTESERHSTETVARENE
jgi:hypothetical protein